MSDAFVRLIPVVPGFVPSEEAATTALEHIRRALPDADEVGARVTDEVSFVDAGANFESACCPLCRSEIDQDWWGDAVGRAAETDFADLTVTVPCCGGQPSLNDLRYEMPQGFARFVIEAMNPNVDELPEGLVGEIADILRHEIRVIWAHD
jgi:hypothetical protein